MAVPTAILALCFSLVHQGAALGSASEDWSDPLDDIDGNRIMGTVRDLEDFGSRAFHLDSSHEAAAYILDRFTGLGLETSFQNFTIRDNSASNVIAVIPGDGPEPRTIVIGAHYDSENLLASNLSLAQNLTAPGADDDASGVAAVIELATVFAGIDTSDTMKFVAFGAEELGYDESGGLKGSYHFVAQEKGAGVDYEIAVIIDMIGYRADGQNRMTVVNGNASDAFAPRAVEAVNTYGLSLSVDVKTAETIDYSDHASFWNAGYDAVLITEELGSTARPYPLNPYYHTSDDTSDKLSESQIVEVTRCIAAVVLDMAGAEDAQGEDIDEGAFAALATVIGVAMAVPIVFRIGRSRRRKIQ